MVFSLAQWQRQMRASRLAAFVASIALLLAGVAHAGHIHKGPVKAAGEHLACQLCLQFDRVAGSPATPAVIVPAARVIRSSIVSLESAPHAVVPRSYDARGPPFA